MANATMGYLDFDLLGSDFTQVKGEGLQGCFGAGSGVAVIGIHTCDFIGFFASGMLKQFQQPIPIVRHISRF